MKRFKLLSLLLLAPALVLGACNQGGGGSPKQEVTITLNEQSVELKVGETHQIDYTVDPETTNLSFTSADATIASVNESGLITAVKEGETTVTLAVKDYSEVAPKTLTVKVIKGGTPAEPTLNFTEKSIKVDEEFILKVNNVPDGEIPVWLLTGTSVLYTLESIVKADSAKVKGIAVGESTIRVDVGNKTLSCKITVTSDAVDPAEELAKAKEAALKEVNKINPENYIVPQREELSALITKAKADINAATSAEAVNTILNKFKEDLSDFFTLEQLEQAKDGALLLLESYDVEDYVDQDAFNALVATLRSAIEAAKSPEEVNNAMSSFTTAVAELELVDKPADPDELADAKAAALSVLDDLDKDLYKDQAALEDLIQSFKDAVEAATSIKQVQDAEKVFNDALADLELAGEGGEGGEGGGEPEEEPACKVVIGEQAIALEEVTTDLFDTEAKKYIVPESAKVEVKAGDKIEVYFDGVKRTSDMNGMGDDTTSVPAKYNNYVGNIVEGFEIQADASADIIIHVWESGWVQFWITGGTSEVHTKPLAVGFYVYGTFSSWAVLSQYKMTQDAENTNLYHFDGLELTADDSFLVTNETNSIWCKKDNADVKPGVAGTYNVTYDSSKADGVSVSFEKIGGDPLPDPVELITFTVTDLPAGLDADGAVLFAWCWGGDAGLGKPYAFTLDGTSGTFQAPKDITGFLLMRCAAGTTTPDWSATGDVAGRVYKKSADFTISESVTTYTSTAWSDYNP